MTSSPVPHFSLFLAAFLTLCSGHSIAARCDQDWVMVKTFPLTSNTELTIGQPVKITGRDKNMVLVESTNTWVPASHVLPIREFRPVDQWPHKKKLKAADGDYDAAYAVNPDGTFVVKETAFNAKDETYRPVRRTGRFYSMGNLYWAKIGNQCPTADRMFVKSPGKGICWQGYMGVADRGTQACHQE